MKTPINSHCPVGILCAYLQANDSACVGLLTCVLECSLWPGNFYHMYTQGAEVICVCFSSILYLLKYKYLELTLLRPLDGANIVSEDHPLDPTEYIS